MPSKSDPLKSFRFLVEVEAGGKKTVAAFSRFSGVKMRLETVDVRTGAELRGVLDCVPALTSYENVTLTKGVIGDNEFLDWILAATPGITVSPTGKDLCRMISIVALDDTNKRAVTWTLADAMPVGYELNEMDASANLVLSESIEFTIAGFRRETHSPPISI
jgi:phage tail-like protein